MSFLRREAQKEINKCDFIHSSFPTFSGRGLNSPSSFTSSIWTNFVSQMFLYSLAFSRIHSRWSLSNSNRSNVLLIWRRTVFSKSKNCLRARSALLTRSSGSTGTSSEIVAFQRSLNSSISSQSSFFLSVISRSRKRAELEAAFLLLRV